MAFEVWRLRVPMIETEVGSVPLVVPSSKRIAYCSLMPFLNQIHCYPSLGFRASMALPF
jgi:hypothetical protein